MHANLLTSSQLLPAPDADVALPTSPGTRCRSNVDFPHPTSPITATDRGEARSQLIGLRIGQNNTFWEFPGTKTMAFCNSEVVATIDDDPSSCRLASVPALCAIDQFVALLMSSHPRCGPRSPAGPVCSVAPLARHIWDMSGVVYVVLEVNPEEEPPESRCAMFGVSGATLGVTYGPVSGPNRLRDWKTPGLWVHRDRNSGDDDGVGYLVLYRADYGTLSSATACCAGGGEVVPVALGCMSGDSAINRKWFVACADYSGAVFEGYKLIISNIQHGKEPDVMVAVPGSEKLLVCQCYVFFNKVAADEALVVMLCAGDHYGPAFTLFDVGATYRSREPAVVMSSICTTWPPYNSYTCEEVLIMRRQNGDVIFILKAIESVLWGAFAVEPTTGVFTQFVEHCSQLSQVSNRVFCTGCQSIGTYELWDCNNLATPLRKVSDRFHQVVGGSGLLFAVQLGNRKITVLEATSGITVLTIEVTSLPRAVKVVIQRYLLNSLSCRMLTGMYNPTEGFANGSYRHDINRRDKDTHPTNQQISDINQMARTRIANSLVSKTLTAKSTSQSHQGHQSALLQASKTLQTTTTTVEKALLCHWVLWCLHNILEVNVPVPYIHLQFPTPAPERCLKSLRAILTLLKCLPPAVWNFSINIALKGFKWQSLHNILSHNG
ncbi:hypothetical protein Pelo_6707 [Pelomyxa schiedti]|nr:hypothetical protein Pelo_6707 [Pelomyxa schiedti]